MKNTKTKMIEEGINNICWVCKSQLIDNKCPDDDCDSHEGQPTEDQKISKIKIGQIFYTSWGYDQTNYDYIIIESMSPSGKTAICKRATHETVGYESLCNVQKPKAEAFGKSFRMKIVKGYDGEPRLRGSYIFCGDENSESKRLGSFGLVKEGKVFYETDSQFGH